MKVYELMQKLSELPAGDEISIMGWLSDEDILKAQTDVEIDNGIVDKRLEFSIEGAEYISDGCSVITILSGVR